MRHGPAIRGARAPHGGGILGDAATKVRVLEGPVLELVALKRVTDRLLASGSVHGDLALGEHGRDSGVDGPVPEGDAQRLRGIDVYGFLGTGILVGDCLCVTDDLLLYGHNVNIGIPAFFGLGVTWSS